MRSSDISGDGPELWDLLGGVRFLLAFIVLFAHLPPEIAKLPLFHALSLFSAPTAVFCFLVISGYSIAHSLSRGSQRFYRRRLLRIYPLYFLSLIVAAWISRLPGGAYPVQPLNLIANLCFLQTFTAAPLAADAVVWSLAVEVACYLAAPFLQKLKTTTLLSIAGLSAACFIVFPQLHLNYYAWLPHGGALLFLSWAWIAGFVYYRHRTSPQAGTILIAAVVIFTSINSQYAERFQHVTVTCALGVLVFGRSIRVNPTLRKLLCASGNYSFPLYLIHGPILMLCVDTLKVHSPFVMISLALGASAVALFLESKLRKPAEKIVDGLEVGVHWLSSAAKKVQVELSIPLLQDLITLPIAIARQFKLVGPVSIALLFLGYYFQSHSSRNQTLTNGAEVSNIVILTKVPDGFAPQHSGANIAL